MRRYCLYNDLQIKNITLLTYWLLSHYFIKMSKTLRPYNATIIICTPFVKNRLVKIDVVGFEPTTSATVPRLLFYLTSKGRQLWKERGELGGLESTNFT